MKKILSICGGGIRGIIPAMVLEEIERQTGKLSRDIFDFAAGTSTGALIAAAIAAGVPASRIVEVYTTLTKGIFSPTGLESDALLLARGYRFGVEKLYAVTHMTLGAMAEERLNNLPIDIMLTAIAEEDGHPWYFVKDNRGNSQTTGNFPLAGCATASGAAPTYFDSFTMPNTKKKYVDGGLGVVGNPVYQACVEAFDYTDGKYMPWDTFVLSLGTGIVPNPAKPTGQLLSKLRWILDVSLDAPRNQQTELVTKWWLWFGKLKGFKHLDIPIPKIGMADVGSIEFLQAAGAGLAKTVDAKVLLML